MLRLKLCYTCLRSFFLSFSLSPLLLIPFVSLLAPFVRWLSAHQALIYGPKNVGHVGHSNRSKQRQQQQQKATAKRPHEGSTWSHTHTHTHKQTNKQIDTEVGFRGEWERGLQSIEMFNEFFTFNCLALHSLLLHSRSCCCCCLFFWHSRCCGALCNRQSHAHVHAHAQWDTHHMQAALAAAEPSQRPQQRRRVYLYCVCVCVYV